MAIRPVNDEVTLDRLLGTLDVAIENAKQQRASAQSPRAIQAQFLSWFRKSHSDLRSVATPTAVSEIFNLETAARVGTMKPLLAGGDSAYGLIEAEFDILVDALSAERDALSEAIKTIAVRSGRFVVFDTTVPITHKHKLRDIIVADDLDTREEPIRVVFPMAVVDELDSLKEHRDSDVRWRAGHTLGVLYELLRDGRGPMLLRESTFPPEGGALPRGEVSVEVWHDPADHRRVPIIDDEIIRRALDLASLARGRSVTLLTFDTSMALRAKAAGLDVVRLDRARHFEARWLQAMDSLERSLRERPAVDIKPVLRREWGRFNGGGISDPELSKMARDISKGTKVEFTYDPTR